MKKMLFFLFAGLLSASAFAGDVIQFKDPWVREGPPNARVLAAFVTIHNKGKEDAHLVAASSPAFGNIELHRTIMKDGMARMVPQKEIVIPAGKMVQLKPGDYHMMLFQVKKSLHAGDKVHITMDFGKQGKKDVVFTVRKGRGGMHQHMHMHMN